MYSYADRVQAVELFIKLGVRVAETIHQLGYPTENALKSWHRAYARINAAVLGMKIGGKPVDFGVLPCGYMPLDVDTIAMDNSGTAKEHVGRTYAGGR